MKDKHFASRMFIWAGALISTLPKTMNTAMDCCFGERAAFEAIRREQRMRKKSKSKRFFLIVLFLLFLAGVAVVLFCYNQEGFTGNRIKNPDAYLLNIERRNGTDLHTFELQEDGAE